MIDFEKLLQVLSASRVNYIIVGGFAGTLHGSSIPTQDLDVVYERDEANIKRLITALESHAPYLRGAPPGLPFHWETKTIENGLNFTLTSDLGDLDLLGEIAGGGDYSRLLPHSVKIVVFGVECLCLKLEKLIEVKRAAGRVKDLQAVADLEALAEERDKAD